MSSEKRVEAPRLFLIGLGVTALSALEALAERFEVVGVVREAAPGPDCGDELVELASKLGLPVSYDASLRSVRTLIENLRPDCVVISSYNRILPPDLLGLSKFINVHYAPLPKYRGRANVNWAIINGEEVTGISIHLVSPGLDAGNILFQEIIPISDTDTVATLYERLNAIQRRALGGAVSKRVHMVRGQAIDHIGRDPDTRWAAVRRPRARKNRGRFEE